MPTEPGKFDSADGGIFPKPLIWVIGISGAFFAYFFSLFLVWIGEPWATLVALFMGGISMGFLFLENPDRGRLSARSRARIRGVSAAIALLALVQPAVKLATGGKLAIPWPLVPWPLAPIETIGLVLLLLYLVVVLACLVFPFMDINRDIRKATPRNRHSTANVENRQA